MDAATLDDIVKGSTETEFTDDDMLDVATMADMAASGMEIPSEDMYATRALAWKKAALQAKQKGDIETAKKLLSKARQFEAAIEQLFRMGKGDESELAAMMDGDDGEDYSLLDELLDTANAEGLENDDLFRDLYGSTNTNVVELDDLDDLDAAMLRDMMESGMEIPNVDEVLKSAQDKKAMAIEFKKQGNIVAAKGALEESKRLEGKARQLSDMLRAIENGTSDENQNMDPEAMFQAMMQASNENGAAPKKKEAAQTAAVPVKETLKSSHEYKVEAVRFKKENKMQEAAAMLRLYKEALAAETSAANLQKKKERIALLQAEMDLANKQRGLFRFYSMFVDGSVGSKQVTFWKRYQRACRVALQSSQTSEELPNLTRSSEYGALELVAKDLSFVGESCNKTEERIEVWILDAVRLLENKHMKKLLEDPEQKKVLEKNPGLIRAFITVQLPLDPDQPDSNVEQTVEAGLSNDGLCEFKESSTFFVEAPRGSSRFAKLLARRLQRRRVTIDVFHVIEKKGLLSRSTIKTLLGTASLELKELLSSNYIAGEFPLLDKTRRHETGGYVRVAIRTGAPFSAEDVDPSGQEDVSATTGVSSTGTVVKPYAVFSSLLVS